MRWHGPTMQGGLTPDGADSSYQRSLYRGFLALWVALPSMVVLQTRRCRSAFPLAATMLFNGSAAGFQL
jgi:hypothetical protein